MHNLPVFGALGEDFILLWRVTAHKSSCRLRWEGVVCSSKLDISLLKVNSVAKEKGNAEQEEIKKEKGNTEQEEIKIGVPKLRAENVRMQRDLFAINLLLMISLY